MNNINATAASFLYFLFAECKLTPENISDGKNGDFLIKDHDAFISGIKNVWVEWRMLHNYYDKKVDWNSVIIKVPFKEESFYIVCHKAFNESKNEEYQHFIDRMTGVK